MAARSSEEQNSTELVLASKSLFQFASLTSYRAGFAVTALHTQYTDED